MTTTISDIRYNLEREIGEQFDNELIMSWCNNAQNDFGASINVPATSTIAVTTTNLTYALPIDLKTITRLWSQTDYNNGIDTPITNNYRVFNGNIIFPTYFIEAFTLNIDYYKTLKYFTAMTDAIDIDDRFITIYTYYCKAMYYAERKSIQGTSIRDIRIAMLSAQSIMNQYNMIKNQIIQEYSFRNEPATIQERW